MQMTTHIEDFCGYRFVVEFTPRRDDAPDYAVVSVRNNTTHAPLANQYFKGDSLPIVVGKMRDYVEALKNNKLILAARKRKGL